MASLDDQLKQRLPQQTKPKNDIDPTQVEQLDAPQLRDSGSGLFILTAVEISGSKQFDPKIFAPMYENMLARRVTVEGIALLTDKITEHYRENGFFLSRATAPAQSGFGGVLKIEIAEGYLDSVSVVGENAAEIRKRLMHLKNQRPLKLSSLQRAILTIGDLNGVKVEKSEIKPDPEDLARHHLVLTVKADKVEASLYADNRGTDTAGKHQTFFRAAVNSVATTGDQLSASIFTTPAHADRLLLGEGQYKIPVSKHGAYLTVGGYVSKFDAGASLAAVNSQSTTKQVSVSLSHPFKRSKELSVWGNIGFKHRDIREEDPAQVLYDDRLRVLYGSVALGSSASGRHSSAFVQLSQGLSMFNASNGGMSFSRPDADAQFTKLQGTVSHYRDIGDMFGIYLSAKGQYSFDPLLASEEFAAGGGAFGRAYDYYEISGEDGVAGLIEFRFGRRPNSKLLDFYQVYAYSDIAAAWDKDAITTFSRETLASAGGGVRLTLPKSLYVTFEAAKPLDAAPLTQSDKDWRAFFTVSKKL